MMVMMALSGDGAGDEGRTADESTAVRVVTELAGMVGSVAAAMAGKRSAEEAVPLVTGADLRRWRLTVGLSQGDLGRRLGYSGHTICQWETSAKRVPPAQERRILEELLKAKQERETLRCLRDELDMSGEGC